MSRFKLSLFVPVTFMFKVTTGLLAPSSPNLYPRLELAVAGVNASVTKIRNYLSLYKLCFLNWYCPELKFINKETYITVLVLHVQLWPDFSRPRPAVLCHNWTLVTSAIQRSATTHIWIVVIIACNGLAIIIMQLLFYSPREMGFLLTGLTHPFAPRETGANLKVSPTFHITRNRNQP